MHTFLNNNNFIYNLQFGFRQYYLTSHALNDITEKIRKALDERNIGRGVFVDLQKVVDTVDQQILLEKLDHYGIRGIFNYWFNSYLSTSNQFVFINGYDSGLAAITCGFPQGCTLIKQENFVKFTVDINNVLCQSNSILKK